MAKMNNTRKSDSWRPGMVANGSGMISKNQKRKEKRYSHNTSSLKSQDTPKSLLGPLSKFKENLNQSLSLPFAGKKESKLLSTSLPIKSNKKSTPLLKKFKPAGILSNSNTPKKGNKVTFNMDKNVDKLIDSEAEEGEEPVTDKVVKPYEKGSKQRQQLKRRMSMMDDEESDEEDSDDESNDSGSLVDMEASEGEETDSAEDEESDDEQSDDFLTDNSDEEVDDDGADVDSEDESEGDEEESEGEESEDESEEEMTTTSSAKVATPNRRESVAAVAMKGKAESTPLPKKVAVKVDSQSKKVDVKIESTPQSKKANESEQKKVKGGNEPKNVTAPVKGQQATVQQNQSKVQKDEKKFDDTVVGQTSPFVGFIRKIFDKVSLEDAKSALSKKIDAKKIVGLRLASLRNAFVYLKDEDTLDSLLNKEFVVNEDVKFVVYKARDSASEKEPKYVAFLPKVPLTKTVAELKEAIEKLVGTGCVAAVKFRKVFKRLQTRNVLVYFNDVESLKKMIRQEELQVGSEKMIVRPAFETTVDIPTHKVLVTSIPEKTTEATLKKAIESQVGKDSVNNVQFSQKKASFAYVTMKNDETLKLRLFRLTGEGHEVVVVELMVALCNTVDSVLAYNCVLMKILEIGGDISVNGTKLEVIQFKPHLPTKKRAAPSDQAKEAKKNKAKKRKLADGAASGAANAGEKKKANVQKPSQPPSKGAAAQSEPKKEVQNSDGQQVVAKSKKKRSRKPKKSANANEEAGSPVKGPVPSKNVNQKREPQSPANGSAPKKAANQNQKPQSLANGPTPKKGANQNQKPQNLANGPTPKKGVNQKQGPQSPANGPAKKGANQKPEPQSPADGSAPAKNANSKRRQKKLKKDAANAKPGSPNPVVSVNGFSPSNSKQKKNKHKQQHSPKPVDAKKRALVEKIASKKKNKKNSMKRDAS